MAFSSNNPLSSMSYTNRDFRSIFEELLDLTKKLTYKWDPSISNESDPGVILLKLNAIIGDKNNYNIDKNILEDFPETVTQEVSARNMYKQLAYNMPWYQSATTTVTFKWVGEELEPIESVEIPRFTMLTNSETSIVYTLLDDVYFTKAEPIATGRVMQGIVTDLIVNGEKDLHLNNIDYNNRIYLNDNNVAENGIFITNAQESSAGYWEKVDNLQVNPLGNRYYEFGVDSRSNATYVEFPDDIETLINAGLNIKYLISDGYEGNVAAKEIVKFYEDFSVEFRGESLTMNDDVVKMYNPSATKDGKDPEPVSKAFKSYRKVAGTFDTLVTLRDYINAIYKTDYVSNVTVSDRLTDIQSSYKIVTDSAGSSDSVVEYAKHIDNDDSSSKYDMTAYDLKLYLLHSAGVIDSIDAYEQTFEMEPYEGTVHNQIVNYIKSTRCMQHDFQPLLENLPCLFRNVYPVRIKFVPQYRLTPVQVDDVKRKIMQSLFDTLNAREIEFGDEPDYNIIHDAILNADERIKMVVVDDFSYTTYATYWDGSRFKSIPISEYNDPYIIIGDDLNDLEVKMGQLNNPERYTFVAKSSTTFQHIEFKENTRYQFKGSLRTISASTSHTLAEDEVLLLFNKNGTLSTSTVSYTCYTAGDVIEPTFDMNLDEASLTDDQFDALVENKSGILIYSSDSDSIYQTIMQDNIPIIQEGQKIVISENKDVYNGIYRYSSATKRLEFYSDYTSDFRKQIIAKSILAGVTPLYKQETTFQHTLDQIFEGSEKDVDRITTSLSISPWGFQSSNPTEAKLFEGLDKTDTIKEYTLKENESLQFLAPSFVSETNYSTYVKFELILSTQKPSYEYQDAKVTYYDWDNNLYNGKIETLYQYLNYYEGGKEPGFWEITLVDGKMDPKLYSQWKNNQVTLYISVPVYRIPPNTDYKLKPGDSIGFFYSDSNEESAPYNYVFYRGLEKETETEKSPIIRSTFTLNGTDISNCKINPNKYGSTGQIPYDYSPNSDYQLIKSMYGDNDLSGSKSIDIRNINQVTIRPNQNYYYFITNQIEIVRDSEESPEKEQYVMTFQPSPQYSPDKYYRKEGTNFIKLTEPEAPSDWGKQELFSETDSDEGIIKFKFEYTLKTDEYFIYTNKSTTEFELVGQGTLIRFLDNPGTDQSSSLRVDTVNYDDVAMYGLQSFVDSVKEVPVEGIVREQQIYNLTGGDKVRITLDNTYPANTPLPSFTTDKATVVDKFQVSYSADGNTFENLPGIDIDDEEATWKGTAILNLDASGDDSQFIDNEAIQQNKQSIQSLLINNTYYPGIDVDGKSQSTAATDSSKLYLLSDATLNKVGGTNVDVSYVDAYGERKNLELFIYGKNSIFSKEPFFNNPNLGMYMLNDSQEISISNQKFDSGYYYLLGIKNTSADSKFGIFYRTAEDDISKPVKCLNVMSDSGNYPYGRGKYYFLIDNVNQEVIELIIKTDFKDDTGYLEFDDLLKCTKNSLFEERYGIKAEDIENMIRTYDYEGLFKYNVKVSAEVRIEDPLVAKTFFDENHVCNRYVIGNAMLRMLNTTSSDSSITIINNR